MVGGQRVFMIYDVSIAFLVVLSSFRSSPRFCYIFSDKNYAHTCKMRANGGAVRHAFLLMKTIGKKDAGVEL